MARGRVIGLAIAVCAVGLALLCPMVEAGGTATVSGTVVDATGAPIGAATVTLKNQSGRIVKEIVVPASGEYSFEGLEVGKYTLLVVKVGFYPLTQDVTLTSGQASHLSFKMTRTEFADQITVNFLAPRSSTGTKIDVPVRDVPLSIQSYTTGFMEAIKADRAGDLYDYMAGVSASGSGAAYDFTIRGMQAKDPSSVLVDGLPGLSARWGSPSTISVERVEVVKGPESVLYGQLQPGGLINLVTKKPQFERSGLVELLAGTYDGYGHNGKSYEGRLDLTGPLGDSEKLAYRLFGMYQDAKSFRGQPLKTGFHPLDAKSRFIGGALTWNASDSTTFTLYGEYRKDTVGWDMGTVFPDNRADLAPNVAWVYQEPGDNQLDYGNTFTFTANKMFSNGVFWQLNSRFVDHHDELHAYESVSLAADGHTLVRQARHQINHRKYQTIDNNFDWTTHFLGLDHQLLAGAQLNYELKDFDRRNLNRDPSLQMDIYEPVYGAPEPPIKPGNHRIYDHYNYGAYAQDMMSVGARWKILVGARYDNQDVKWKNLSNGDKRHHLMHKLLPMGGFVYQPSESWSLYGSYSTSFVPAVLDRLNADKQPDFPPEEGTQYEIGAKYVRPDGTTDATLSLYDLTRKNVTEKIDTGVYALVGEQQSKGAELELRARLFDRKLQILFGYAYTDATITKDANPIYVGSPLTNTPKNSATLWAKYEFPQSQIGAFAVGGGLVYEDAKPASVVNSDGIIAMLPGHTRVDFTIHYQRKWLRLNLLVTNLFDKLYYLSSQTYAPTVSNVKITVAEPRQLRLTMGVAF